MSSSAVDIQEARAHSVTVSDEALSVDLVDGRTVIVPLLWFPRLWHGSKEERNNLEIFGDGVYIHWPDLDEDLTVAGLLEGKRSGECNVIEKVVGVQEGHQQETVAEAAPELTGGSPVAPLVRTAGGANQSLDRTNLRR